MDERERERIEELQKLLDPRVRDFYAERLNEVTAMEPQLADMRQNADLTFNDRKHREEIERWEDREICCNDRRIPIRIFDPRKENRRCPLLLYFHGGGFVIHNIQSHDDLCRRIANAGGCVVVSVGYRLAPEHPWPACLEDGYEALRWAFRSAGELSIDEERIAVGGDSAGATISAVVSLMNRDERRRERERGGDCRSLPRIAMQILCYGSFGTLSQEGVDLSRDSSSIRQFGYGGFVLPKRSMDWFLRQYVPFGTEEDHPYLNPGRAKDLSGLPQTLCITAQCDPLRDDGEAFAAALCAAKNDVTILRIEGMMHGFLLYWYLFDRSNEAVGQIGKALQSMKNAG